ncbi:reverse transcriptase domain protein [Paraphaeosphaeria minitans]|uniref:Reverse transcriptase domain protein n=1 Tax=Paraphaeosphaeria minitans TaxID=565426 RepID=A0A9P6KNB0_9PLEO|nr:reverse transcriptase domain protein [Paraphaeosphaeria minitans]
MAGQPARGHPIRNSVLAAKGQLSNVILRKYNHKDASLACSCGRGKTPEHLALCRKTLGAFGRRPLRPPTPPSSRDDSLAYTDTAVLMGDPEAFETFTQLTQYYTKVCPRWLFLPCNSNGQCST